MSRVPSYPYRVLVTRDLAGGKQQTEQHNYSNLAGAIAYRDIQLGKKSTRKVEVVMVIDESTPSHRGDDAHRQHPNIRAFNATH